MGSVSACRQPSAPGPSFAAQVLLVHAFALVLDQSVYAFGAVLVVVFASLAAGSAIVATVYASGRISPPAMLAAALVLSALGLALFPELFHRVTGGLRYVEASGGWGPLGAALATAAAAAGPPLLAVALVFPSVLAVSGTSSQDPAARPVATPVATPIATRLGRLLAANTAGAVAGALLAPFALLPGLGPWRAFAALAVVYGAAALLVPSSHRRARLWQAGALAGGWMVVLAVANPLALSAVTAGPGEVVLFEATTPAGVVAVLEHDGERLIRTDNHYNLGGSRDAVHQERQGHLPLLLHPGARRVAFLGSATGISAGAATLHPIAAMHLVELVPGVAQAAIHHFHDANRGVHEDPRTRLVLDDARNFLRVTSERFDAIVGDLFVPWRSGTHALYAREHFAAARERLEPDGLFCQWLPLYQLTEEQLLVIAATFLDVFPQSAVFRGDFFGRFPIIALVGWKGRPAPAAAVSASAARLAKALDSDRWLTGPVGVWSLYVGPLGPLAPDLVDVPRNRDDRPRIAFLAARTHVGGSRVLLEPMSGLRWVRFQESLQRAAQRHGDDIYPDLDERQRAAVRGGTWLQIASALWVAGRADEASQALERAAHALPRHLLADAPADPTAADVWVDR
jgi:spermidine synthase